VKALPVLTVVREGTTDIAVTEAGVCTVSAAVTVFVGVPAPPTFASTHVALAESVPVAVAVHPLQVMAVVAPTPFTGNAGGVVHAMPAPPSDAAVTLAAAVPVFDRLSVTVNACPAFTGVREGATDVAVTTAAVCTVVAGLVEAAATSAVPVPAAVPFAVAVKVIVPAPDTVQLNA
jgi:hypothetical protein